MTDIAIRVDNLSKLYPELSARAVHQRPDTTSTVLCTAPRRGSASLRDALTDFLPRISRIRRNQKDNSRNLPNTCTCVRRKCSRQVSQENSPNSPNSRQAFDDLWALKDVSFEVKRGEVVG